MAASISALATLTPPSTTRAWQTAAHPALPLVATASSDRAVRVYSLASFRAVATVSGGHKRSVRACAWKPGSGPAAGESVLATGSFDASAGVWRKWEGRGGGVDVARARGDGEGGGAREEGEDDGGDDDDDDDDDDDEYRFAVLLDGPDSEIKSVAWSAGGQYLATCSRDKSVWVWEEMEDDNFETVAVLQEHEADVKCVAWHPQEDLLASASYDDTVRLYREDLDDWGCVAVLGGHGSTVWGVDFEGVRVMGLDVQEGRAEDERTAWLRDRARAGPRLVSCSDDTTVRVWRRRPKARAEQAAAAAAANSRIPSIIRSNSIEEDWFEEARLPQRHERAVYAAAWSKRSGLIASTGSDGKIVVYKERWRRDGGADGGAASAATGGDGSMDATNGAAPADKPASNGRASTTEWCVLAELEAAHDVFEVNHVCWARRCDKGRRRDDEEIIVSTGDDGEVKLWTLEGI